MSDKNNKIESSDDSKEIDETVSLPSKVDDAQQIGSELPTIDFDQPASPKDSVATPSIPGFEIIEEIGRGGMGVVYKANDSKLNRLVALKMILGGRLASSEEIARFRLEAEAAARLDNAGIVPIYGVDQAGEHHYFSMKYIEGTSLSLCTDVRDDTRSAVKLLYKVARAVQHAHERGILHRDLKPSNILIDSDGQPLVTDFGLAKHLDEDSNITQTGTAMGTPGFMAPEQAKGERDITIAADVFSLGAILFWMQTGETPFKGDTPMQRLMSTLQDEIPSTKSVVAKPDLGLDLICQKAMSREPTERYGAVASFADDLQAWLDGEPLSVRAPGLLESTRRWVRKNLRTVLGAAVSGITCGAILGVVFNLEYWHSLVREERRTAPLDGHLTWLSGLDWLNDLSSDSIEWVRMGTPLIVAICAFLTVLFVRPKTREANIVSAATTGLAALAVSLLVGIGWSQMAANSVENGKIDIEFLATTLWMDSPQERELAREIMDERYPGLQKVEADYRSRVLADNILIDQTKGLLPGMWSSAWVALLVAAFPLSISCFLSGHSWQQGQRGASWFVLTVEHSVYCLLGFTTVAMLADDVAPESYRVLLCAAAMLLGLVVAILRKSWYLRIVLFALVIWILIGVRANQENIRLATYNAGYAKTDDQLRRQLLFANLYLEQKDDSHARYQTAIGWLYLGEEDEYLKHCRYLFENFQPGSVVGFYEQLAKVSLLKTSLHPRTQIETAHQMADKVSKFDSAEEAFWMFMTRGLSEQRKNNTSETLTWTKRARDDANHTPHYMHACSHAIDALAYMDIDDSLAAKRSLQEGETVYQSTMKRVSKRRDVGWVDRLIFVMLKKEVETRDNFLE